MARINGRALLPLRFIYRYCIPQLIHSPREGRDMIRFALRRYFASNDPDVDMPISQISLRVNEMCNLRCASCGQWGENGHLRKKLEEGSRLQELDFSVVRELVTCTSKDHPFYYVWGGEPTLWKPLLPLFQEMARHRLSGSLVTNAQALLPILDDLIATGSLMVLFLSLDGWDSTSQNMMRSPASGRQSDNFEKTMAVIQRVEEIKRTKNLMTPFVIPITVISNLNYAHLAEIHKCVMNSTQLHPYYFGWFITAERAFLHEEVFANRFGFSPKNHCGYLKSCFNEVDPIVTEDQIRQIRVLARKGSSIPQFLPDISNRNDIGRYYSDHAWDCGYPTCESIYHVAEISPDGTVTPCRDYQDYKTGNINEQGFYEIWNGSRFKKFRKEMKKGLMPVCTRCCGLQGF